MRLLLDENLSRRLLRRIEDLFPGSTHVANEDLLEARDTDIWEYARVNGFVIVTADADFYELATTLDPPPKVILLRGCDYPTSEAELLMRSQVIRITDFLEDAERAVLILQRQ